MLTIVAHTPPGQPMFALLFATAAVLILVSLLGLLAVALSARNHLAGLAIMTLWFAVQYAVGQVLVVQLLEYYRTHESERTELASSIALDPVRDGAFRRRAWLLPEDPSETTSPSR